MESLRDIKNRKIATQKTAQITSAMNMVSASKLKKAERQYKLYKDYLSRIIECISSISANYGDKHPMFEVRPVKKTAYVIITSDRGLAGSYNSNIFKKITEEVSKLNKDEYVIGSIGKKGFAYCQKKGYSLYDEPIYIRDNVEFSDITNLTKKLIKDFLDGQIDKVVVCYNNYINTLVQDVCVQTIMPICDINNTKSKVEYEYDQGIEKTLDLLLPMYVENVLYGLIIDAKTSEHASRMTAMRSATDNANDVIYQLQLLYNRARQASITKELTDIIGGANAV